MKNLFTNKIMFTRILFYCGVFLITAEFIKQLLLYFVVTPGYYDWWFFPFQLCSLPMYLCAALPWLPARQKKNVCTFMQDFNLLGAAAALIVSDGFPRGHWYLSLHAYVWHILLLLIGIYIPASGQSDNSWKGFWSTLPLFAGGCVIATLINLAAPGTRADMFYISPYHLNEQLLYNQIATTLGLIPGHLFYLVSICVGSGLLHLVFQKIRLERFTAG